MRMPLQKILSAVNQLNGSAAISMYTMECLGGKWIAVEMGFLCVLCTFVGSFIPDPFGRRPVLIVSQVGCAVSTLFLFFYFLFEDVRHIRLLLYFGIFCFCFFGTGISVIVLSLPSEMFPTPIRAFINGLTQTVDSIACFIALKMFTPINEHLGIEFNFIINTVISFIGSVTATSIPETAGIRIAIC